MNRFIRAVGPHIEAPSRSRSTFGEWLAWGSFFCACVGFILLAVAGAMTIWQ